MSNPVLELVGADVAAGEPCAFHPACPPHAHHADCGDPALVVLLFAVPGGQGHHRMPVCGQHAEAAAHPA